MRSIVASHWKLTMKNSEQWSKLILLLLHKKLPKNSMSTILWLFSIWSKLERWTTLISGCLMSWPKIFKKSSFWSVVFSYSMQQQQTISWWDCDMMKSEFYMTTDNDQPVVGPRISSNALPKNKLAPKKVIITIWWSAVDLIHQDPGETIHLRSMFNKSMSCTKNCHTYSRNWSIERAPFFTMTTPNHTFPNQCFKIWATKFCLICHLRLISPSLARQPTTTSPSISFDNFFLFFLQENTSTTSRRQKMLSKGSSNPDFYATGINKRISYWQNGTDCNGFYFG